MTDVQKFLESIPNEEQRQDAFTLADLMRKATGVEPKMWGSKVVGFGKYHYKYASGHEGDTMVLGFSPRKTETTLYLGPGLAEKYSDLLAKLGKCKMGKGCLYVKKLRDMDTKALSKLFAAIVKDLKAQRTE